MKNVIATLATAAALMTGTAVLADNGFVDGASYVNAQHPNVSAHQTELNGEAHKAQIELTVADGRELTDVTTFPTDAAASASAGIGK